MKKLITSFFILAGLSALAQDKTSGQTTNSQQPKRDASTSAKAQVTEAPPLPYDVNDKYMGRKDEFLNSMIVSEMPADFPIYDKQWGVKEYNAVVDAYYMTHMDILKDRVKEKVQYHIDQQKAK